MLDDQSEEILKLIEAQSQVAGRFTGPKRLPGDQPGFFSLVLSATDSVTGKPVALKFYKIGGEGDSDYRRAAFEREARILEVLRGQEHIIQLVVPRTTIEIPLLHQPTGVTIRFPLEFLALEWASSSLEAVIAKGHLDPRKLIQQFRHVCKGLQRLHRQKICHRDLKPGNCLQLPNGTVVIGDFGTARDYGPGVPALKLSYDRPVGDMGYTGLELICGLGNDSSLSFASDFFSLAAILFEMVTLTPLSGYIYGEALDMQAHFGAIPADRRRQVFDGTISAISEPLRLPDLEDFPIVLPLAIRGRLNRLYQKLAQLDYRRRLTSFDEIFRELEICGRLLERESAYRRWLEQRRRRREVRAVQGSR